MKRTAQTLLAVAVAVAIGAGCGSESTAPGDDAADAGADASTAADAPSGDQADAGPIDPPSGCGDLQPDIGSIMRTEGLVIADDGTIFYSQSKAVGRLRPGQAREDAWARLTAGTGSQVWGLAVTSTHLYVGYPSDESIWRVELATGSASLWLDDAGQPNGVIIGADGALYYSDFAGGEVYRVDLTSAERTRVTTATGGDAFEQPNGLYSVDAEHLLVLAYADADVWQLTLRDGVETARTRVADLDQGDGIRLDGITRDGSGRWYLSDNRGGQIIRRPASFAAPSGDEDVIDVGGPVPAAANLAFGRGALPCDDLYVATSGKLVRVTVD